MYNKHHRNIFEIINLKLNEVIILETLFKDNFANNNWKFHS